MCYYVKHRAFSIQQIWWSVVLAAWIAFIASRLWLNIRKAIWINSDKNSESFYESKLKEKKQTNKIKPRMYTHETGKLTSGADLKHNKLWKFRLTKETIIGE